MENDMAVATFKEIFMQDVSVFVLEMYLDEVPMEEVQTIEAQLLKALENQPLMQQMKLEHENQEPDNLGNRYQRSSAQHDLYFSREPELMKVRYVPKLTKRKVRPVPYFKWSPIRILLATIFTCSWAGMIVLMLMIYLLLK